MRVAVKNHALPVYKENRIASLLCIFESTIETRYRRKDGQKRSCNYFNAVIVHVMLVGLFAFKIHAAGYYHKVKNVQGMLQSGFSHCESIQIDPGQLNTRQFSPL